MGELFIPQSEVDRRERQHEEDQKALKLVMAQAMHEGLRRREQALMRIEEMHRRAEGRKKRRKAQKQARKKNR